MLHDNPLAASTGKAHNVAHTIKHHPAEINVHVRTF